MIRFGSFKLYTEHVAEVFKGFNMGGKRLKLTAQVGKVGIKVVYFNMDVFPQHMDQVILVDNSIWILG